MRTLVAVPRSGIPGRGLCDEGRQEGRRSGSADMPIWNGTPPLPHGESWGWALADPLGGPARIEYSEIGEARAGLRRPDGALLYNEANIAIYTYSVPFLEVSCVPADYCHCPFFPMVLLAVGCQKLVVKKGFCLFIRSFLFYFVFESSCCAWILHLYACAHTCAYTNVRHNFFESFSAFRSTETGREPFGLPAIPCGEEGYPNRRWDCPRQHVFTCLFVHLGVFCAFF